MEKEISYKFCCLPREVVTVLYINTLHNFNDVTSNKRLTLGEDRLCKVLKV